MMTTRTAITSFMTSIAGKTVFVRFSLFIVLLLLSQYVSDRIV